MSEKKKKKQEGVEKKNILDRGIARAGKNIDNGSKQNSHSN
jgi:hypothetical protein